MKVLRIYDIKYYKNLLTSESLKLELFLNYYVFSGEVFVLLCIWCSGSSGGGSGSGSGTSRGAQCTECGGLFM